MRATLHEELMREAGFEVERDLARARRRAEHRHDVRRGVIHALRIAAAVGAVIAWLEWVLGIVGLALGRLPVSRDLFFVGFVLIGVGLAAGTVAGRMMRDETAQAPPSSAVLRAARRMFGRDLVDTVAWARRRMPPRREA